MRLAAHLATGIGRGLQKIFQNGFVILLQGLRIMPWAAALFERFCNAVAGEQEVILNNCSLLFKAIGRQIAVA